MGILSMFGLMTAEEHNRRTNDRIQRFEESIRSKDEAIERLVGERDASIRRNSDLHKDIAAITGQRDEAIQKYSAVSLKYADAAKEIAALAPDAEAMRAKRKRDVEQKAARRRSAATPVSTFTKPIPDSEPVAAKVKKGAR